MKKINKLLLLAFSVLGFLGSTLAASTPSLGIAARFGVLSSTFSITTATTVHGDVGYTTLSNPLLTVVGGGIFVPSPSQAGIDQGTALADLNSQPCTFSFAAGAIDLATDITHGPLGVYTGGVYCTTTAAGAMSIGAAGITLSGAGTFIFRTSAPSNALTTLANSIVVLTGGASACDVFWTPTAATTLGADSLFKGTVIDDAGITVGNNVTREGRALDYATTVTTNNSTITNTCGGAAGTGMLHVIKTVVGGSAFPSDFRLYVNYGGAIVGSGLGTGGIGTLYIITGGTYTVSEDANSSYTQSLGVNCSNVTIFSGDDKTCIITNTYITPPSGGGGGWSLSKDSCPKGDYSSGYYDGTCGIVPTTTGNVALIALFTPVVTGTIVASNNMTSTPLATPGFPKTGIISQEKIIPWNLILLASILTALSISSIVLLKKHITIK